MAGFKRFEDIVAWQLAFKLKAQVQNVCKRESFNRDWRLRDQLLDAARSGPRNIAEGFGRWRHGDFARFTRIAKASEVEVLNHLQEACASGHITEAERATLEHSCKKAIKTANGLIRYLESSDDPE